MPNDTNTDRKEVAEALEGPVFCTSKRTSISPKTGPIPVVRHTECGRGVVLNINGRSSIFPKSGLLIRTEA